MFEQGMWDGVGAAAESEKGALRLAHLTSIHSVSGAVSRRTTTVCSAVSIPSSGQIVEGGGGTSRSIPHVATWVDCERVAAQALHHLVIHRLRGTE